MSELTPAELAQELHRDRYGVVVTLMRCDSCGLIEEREIEEGVPDPCTLCDSQEASRA